jgi:prephenate dehydratase
MFFVDLEGAGDEAGVGDAIAALRTKAENVRVLGSYPLASPGIPGA